MTLELLFPHFDELIRTPEDVQRLNEAILQLAVQGKLVPQDPEDEPAGELLKRIEATRRQLAEAGRVDKARDTSEIELHEYPFQLPTGWSVTRLGALVSKLGAGSTPLGGKSVYENGGVKFIRSQNVWNDGLRLDDVAFIPESIHQRMSGTAVMPKDVLLNITGASIGRSAIVPDDFDVGNVSQHVAIVRLLEPELRRFVHLYVISPYFQRMIMDVEVGISREGLSMSRLQHFLLPLPPLAEQHRIVAKVDELFAQTRALAAKLRQAQADIVTANRAALHRLHRAQDDGEFQAAWCTLRDHFDLLYNDPRNVADLRQAILDLAVRGKLVPQDAEDEPAGESLNFVHQTSLSFLPIDLQINLFRKPTTWTWKRLGDLAEIVSGVTLGRNLQGYDMVALPYLRVANVQRGYLDLSEIKEVEVKVEEKDKYLLQEGDLLLTEGGDADKLGRAAIWRGQIPNCIHQNHIFRARPTGSAASAEWLMLCTNSSYGRNYFLGSSKKTTNLATINSTQLRNCPIPLPSPAEQRRILAKVDQLMRLCDALQAGLVQAEVQRRSLTAAVLSGICREAADSPV